MLIILKSNIPSIELNKIRKITDKKVLNTKYLISISNPIKINGRKLKIEYIWGEIF